MKKLMAVVLSVAAFAVWADRVELKSGSFLAGKVKSVSRDAVVFASDDLGDVTIKVANIAKLDVGERDVQKTDLTIEKKPLAVAKGAYVSGAQPLDMSSVKAIDPVAETWHGNIAAAFQAARGNTYETSGSLIANVNRRWEDDRFTGDFGYYYSDSAKGDADPQKTTDRWEVEAKHDHFWLPKVYHYEDFRFERDMIQLLKARYHLGAGGGYQWLEKTEFAMTGKWSFNQELGLSWVKEDYEGSSDAKRYGYCALRYAHHLMWYPKWVDGMEVFHNADIEPEVDEWDKLLVKTDLGFTTKLVLNFDLMMKVEWEYNSKPANDRKVSDFRFIVGLGYKW